MTDPPQENQFLLNEKQKEKQYEIYCLKMVCKKLNILFSIVFFLK